MKNHIKWNVGNQRTALTNTLGDYRNYTYDSAGQLKAAFGYESSGTARLNEKLGYLYDAAGNLNQRTNNALVQTFNVNNLNALTTATRSGTLTVAGTTTSAATTVTVNGSGAYLYADNTFAKEGFTVTNGNNTFTAIAQDSYGRKDTNAVSVDLPATVTFVYDLNGNLTSDGKRGFDFDDENQLSRVTVTNEFKKEFVYDGLNRLRIKREYKWSGAWTQTNEVRFIYDGNLVIQHRDGNNLPTLTLTRGNDLSGSLQSAGGIGGLLAMTETYGTHSYYHSDGNGNVTALIGTNQLIAARHSYDSFGVTLSLTGPKAEVNPYWSSSQLYDPDTDFYHYQRRVYLPTWQRFLNRDPIGELGGVNLFGLVGNDPINAIDPLGLASFDPSGAANSWDELIGDQSESMSTSAIFFGDMAHGMADMLRFGEGIESGDYAADLVRGGSIVLTVAGSGKVGRNPSVGARLFPKRLAGQAKGIAVDCTKEAAKADELLMP